MQNFRSFSDSGIITFQTINVIIGTNNSGKSSILRGLHQLQQGVVDQFGDVRVGSANALIRMELAEVSGLAGWPSSAPDGVCSYSVTLSTADRRNGTWYGEAKTQSQTHTGDVRLPNVEPQHFIVPYLSRRKASSYQEDIREQYVLAVTSDASHLAAKLSRLGNPAFPAHAAYAEACQSILGFVVTAIPAPNGQRPGIYLPNQATVPIEQMGEGVPNIVALLANLATSKNKLFLIEEPENDLHPTALRALLQLIIASSAHNQVVVSTHSNIVVRHLCAAPDSQLLRVATPHGVLPQESTIEVVPATAGARISVLRELGYEFSDFDLWDGWLILEESSAERIIRDYLIPWFAPRLTRVRTLAAGGIDRVELVLDDLLRLVVFTHLQPAYSGRTWIRVDNDKRGQSIVERLRTKFHDWPDDRIQPLEHGQFERYYPYVFHTKVDAALAVTGRDEKRQAKRELLSEVMRWLDDDVSRGRAAMAETAKSLIADLKRIEAQLSA